MKTLTEDNLYRTEEEPSKQDEQSDAESADQEEGLVGYQQAIDSDDEESDAQKQ